MIEVILGREVACVVTIHHSYHGNSTVGEMKTNGFPSVHEKMFVFLLNNSSGCGLSFFLNVQLSENTLH